MLNKKSLILVVALVLCAGSVQAAQWGHSSMEPGRVWVNDNPAPLAAQSLTQNVDPNTIVSGTSVACVGAATTDTGWWRLYDLDGQFSLVGTFATTDVDYGIEVSAGLQDITANVYCLDDGLPFLVQFLALAGTASQNQPDASGEFFNIPVVGSCDSATQAMAVELLSDDCQETGTCVQLFIGANDLGQTAPAYIAAPDCGIIDPIDLAAIGFGSSHIIQVINGTDEGTGGDGGDGGGVPASSGLGMALMILLLLGSSAWFLRRRVTN